MSKPEDQGTKFASRVRLNSIEAFHLHSSSDNWPNSIVSRYHFIGAIDVALAKQAWHYGLSRQLNASWPIIHPTGRPSWHTDSDSKTSAELAESSFHDIVVDHWPDSEMEFELPNVNGRGLPKVAASESIGFGLWCIRSSCKTKVTMLFSTDHTLADGGGGVSFVRDWMLAYNNLVVGNEIGRGITKFDWERWKSRSHLGLLKWSFLKFLPFQAIGFFGATKFIFRKFSTIEPSQSADDTSLAFKSPGIIGRTIAPQLLHDFNDRAQRLSVSENSLLMTILFRAMSKIRNKVESDQGCQWAERKWIRLVLPIGIRGIADRKLPSANKASLVQIERTFAQVANADGAAQSIDREVRIIMGFKLDLVFLIAIRMLSVVPALLRWVAGNQKSRGTTIFSNLGEPFRKTRACNFREVGNIKLVDYDLCGPLRNGTPISFAWSTFKRHDNEELKPHGRVSLHFDRHIISNDLANAIADAFEKELQDVAQFGGSG